jgi:archaellum component FlaC
MSNKEVIQDGVLVIVMLFGQVARSISIFREHYADFDFVILDKIKEEIHEVDVFLPVIDGYLTPLDLAK